MIWAFPTSTSKLPHAFKGQGKPSLCRRYFLQSFELAQVVTITQEQATCTKCRRLASAN